MAAEADDPTLAAAIDPAVLEELRELEGADQPEFLSEMVRMFVARVDALLAAVRDALQRQDAEGIERAAHNLKSCAGTMGAPRMTQLSRDLHERARQGDLGSSTALVVEVEREYRRVRAALAAGVGREEP